MMSSSQSSLRQRSVPGSAKKKGNSPADTDTELDDLSKSKTLVATGGSETDYKIGFVVITILAFISRFWGISHPNEVVFDEVHFGKVSIRPI